MSRLESDFRGERIRGLLLIHATRASAPDERDHVQTVAQLRAAGIGDPAQLSLLLDGNVERLGAPGPLHAPLADDDWLRLTPVGFAYVDHIYYHFPADHDEAALRAAFGRDRATGDASYSPRFDPVKRKLSYRGSLVKDYWGQPQGPQVLILLAFQELGWPETMDDPLHGKRGRNRSHYLRKAIARLNAGQHGIWRIEFATAARGQSIRWRAFANPNGPLRVAAAGH